VRYILTTEAGNQRFRRKSGEIHAFREGQVSGDGLWGIGNSPEGCAAFFKAEMAKRGKVIQDAGLKAE
jgi:hypothetical protein